MAGKLVMVVRAPNYVVDGTAEWLRDFVAASLPMGVVVLPDDISYEIAELPSLLGGVVVSGGGVEEALEPAPAVKPGAVDLPSTVKEKRLIMERLTAYREKHGLGCLAEVAKKSGKGITDDILRRLLSGDATATLAEWRRIGAALNKLEDK